MQSFVKGERRVSQKLVLELFVSTSTNNAHVVEGFAKLAVFSNLAELGHIVINRLSTLVKKVYLSTGVGWCS